MRSSTSTASEEKLRSDLKSAKKAAKKAKAAYKAKLKELRAKIAPLKQAVKDAKAAEKQAKAAYKAVKIKKEQEPTGPNMEPVIPRSRAAQIGTQPTPPAQPVVEPTTSSTDDDLTRVKGVGYNIADMLKANGISSFADMAATSFDRYKELLKANGMSKFRDPSQWAARAAELANLPAPAPATSKAAEAPAAPKKRGRQPGFSPKANKAASGTEAPKAPETRKRGSAGNDNLTKVKGVGHNIADMLKANGISSYADMAATSFDRYKELLKANGMSKFRDPSQWAARAAELANLPAPAPAAPKATEEAPAAPKKRGRQPGFSPKANKAVVNHEEQKAPTTKAATTTGGDNLTKVKGVGQNIADMLKANGITTYADMAATSFDRYKELLKANGMSKFRDPSQWAARAAQLTNAPAAEPKKRGRQPGFSPKAKAAVQAASEDTAAPRKRGRQPGYSPKAAKAAAAAATEITPVVEAAPKAPAKPKGPPAKPDDLTMVKGVGQRVADALNKEGIYTYRDMAEVSLEQYKTILKDNNMSKFRDPSDWARIAAELANKK